MEKSTYCIIVHGGASAFPIDSNKDSLKTYKESILKVVQQGFDILKNGGSALDAVEVAINALENDPLYNSGTGCSLTSSGTVELDAMIIDGSNMNLGSVACVNCTRNPISLARLVMEKSPHCMMVADGAREFAKSQGHDILESSQVLVTLNELENLKKYGNFEGAVKIQMNVPTAKRACDTVGAVALDSHGNIACGTSTGGISGKMPGRVGDAALIGCGGYANKFGGASCTGHGESFMKALCCKNVVLEMENGKIPSEAARSVLKSIYRSNKSCGGIIALNHLGEIATFHSAEFMTWASIHSSNGTTTFYDTLT